MENNVKGKWFLTSTDIRPRDRSQIISIPTGLVELDKKIIGLNKGEVTCVSGLSGSAKSTWLSQLSLEVVNGGKKVALFSGELHESKVLDWLQLQAAGKAFTIPTQWENYFYVAPFVKPYINQWLEQKMFVYNNNYGNKVDDLLAAVSHCIKTKGVDIVILDNLMSIDLGATNFNKNEKQTEFIHSIVALAKQNDVHIALVAHPRKSQGFLRKDDIAGTYDLTNAVDNVFIIHRVNRDFKRLSQLTLGLPADHPIYEYYNCIEICKNRDLGYQDELIGLYFEKESKSFSCDKTHKDYGWLELLPPQAR